MVRCFGVWHGCVRVLGAPIACPVAMIVVRRQFQQNIVALIGVWRDMTGDGVGYDFEYTMQAATVNFYFSTVNTGYWNTGWQDAVGPSNAHSSLPAFETAWFPERIPFSGVNLT